MCAIGPVAERDTSAYPVHGSYGVQLDGRFADPNAFGDDWDAGADLDLRFGDPSRHAFTGAFSGRLLGDIDGRQPGSRPNINNGILETFGDLYQPYVFSAYVEARRWGAPFFEEEGAVVRLGRQSATGGEAVRFDGAAVEGRSSFLTIAGKPVEMAVYGGVPVHLFESANGDWVLGGRVAFGVGRGRMGLEYLHATDKLSLPRGRTRNDNLIRATYRTPVGEAGRFAGTVRAIDAGEVDYDARYDWRAEAYATDLRFRLSGLAGDRGRLANELDAFAVVQGQARDARHRGYNQIEVGGTRSLGDHLALDLGASRRWADGGDDRENVDFGRLFATFMFNGLHLGRMPLDASVTLDGYETRRDFTRHAGGELTLGLSPSVRLTLASAYAIQQFDYNTRTVRDDVRTGTVRLDYAPTDDVDLQARYDIENDDQRVHHAVRLGGRHAF